LQKVLGKKCASQSVAKEKETQKSKKLGEIKKLRCEIFVKCKKVLDK